MRKFFLLIVGLVLLTAANPAWCETTETNPPAGAETPKPATAMEPPLPPAVSDSALDQIGDRDPFEASVAKKLFTADYDLGVENCRLLGLIRMSGGRMGLFAVPIAGGKGQGGVQRVLSVRVGDELRFFIEEVEYVLKVRSLDERFAVLVGENRREYKVWL